MVPSRIASGNAALDWTTSTRISKSAIFEFQTSDVFRALALHVGFTQRGSSGDEMPMCCNNVKPENLNRKVVFVLDLVLVLKSKVP